ncbi:MAG: Ig-like domain-containing protein [Chitinophagales bacterium]
MKKILSIIAILFCVAALQARELPIGGKKDNPNGKVSGKTQGLTCFPATAQAELNINNIRTTLLAGGDLWWDLNSAKYEVPKVERGSGLPSLHSLFAGALWMGGIDNLGILKVAAQTYRQTGNDFFPGPLDDNGETYREICNNFDRFWEVRGEDIAKFIAAFEASGGTISEAQVPTSIMQWPARNNPYFDDFDLPLDKNLAPFWDLDGDGTYDPLTGDYPVIDSNIEGVYADQMIWWMFNDKGDVHSETGGEAIGLEIGSLAFAFATNDEVNNMTFYKYSINNLSTAPLDSVFFGQWVDPDLGNYQDDYVGCDTINELGIVYNGDANDEGSTGYGNTPPMLAVDFFRGPRDENGNILGMSSFVYYNNDFSDQGNPETASHFYGYLSGVWKDRTPFTFGGDGKGGTTPFPFMFPSDPSDESDGAWSECSEQNTPDDRRFLQTSGPFKLLPGTSNEIVVGVVWIRDGLQYICPSFNAIQIADLKAQALFDSNFKLKDGPDAPNITIRELNQELILSIYNPPSSNNYEEAYQEVDAVLSSQGLPDSVYTFQGYRIYQLVSPTVSPAEYGDNAKAKEIFTVDIKDGVKKIINIEYETETGTDDAYVAIDETRATDGGIKHTFRITQDQFAAGSSNLVNHKKYYYSVIAYAYNPNPPTRYLEGRNNIKVYTAVPHISTPELGGLELNSEFGEGPEVTTLSGFGNGGNVLELTEASLQEIMTNNSIAQPTYEGGYGPIDVRVFDPTRVPAHDFKVDLVNHYYVTLSKPSYGTVTENSDGTLTYTPNANIPANVQSDQFSYEIANQFGTIDKGFVTVQLGTGFLGCEANDDIAVVFVDNTNDSQEVTAKVNIDALANDYPFNSSDLEILGYTQPTFGTSSLLANGLLRYERSAENTGYFGVDRFTYTARNTNTGDVSTGNIIVNIVDIRLPGDPEKKDDAYKINAVDDMVVSNGQTVTFNPLDNDVNDLFGTTQLSPYATWLLTDLTSGRVYDYDIPILLINEQAIGGWEYDPSQPNYELYYEPLGFIVGIKQIPEPDNGDNYLASSFTFNNPQDIWFGFISDQDGAAFNGGTNNWIRSGSLEDNGADGSVDKTFSDYAYDPNQYYETVVLGGFGPYCLTANIRNQDIARYNDVNLDAGTSLYYQCISPACSDCYGYITQAGDQLPNPPTNTLGDIRSIDLYFTSNTDLWTQSVVVEMGRDAVNNIGGAAKNAMRQSNSLNKDGSVNTAEVGRSWFPGYAIDVETGRRLNIMFSENSFMAGENGNDMMWNPTSTVLTEANGPSASNYRMGGEHFIYVMNSTYDGGLYYQSLLSDGTNLDNKKAVYDDAMWVGVPIKLDLPLDYKPMSEGLIPGDARVRIRIGRAYNFTNFEAPSYQFSMNNLAAKTADVELAKSALDLVRVVPNPYYAYSVYENTKFENKVKITNLPQRATVKIFSLDGTLIRELRIDNTNLLNGTSLTTNGSNSVQNSLEWDMKNYRGVPVASGLYLFHIEAPDLGEERVLKWFGVMR